MAPIYGAACNGHHAEIVKILAHNNSGITPIQQAALWEFEAIHILHVDHFLDF